MTIERRRSDRLTLTLPLIVCGMDENGMRFESEAQTINISRHGARIRISRHLRSGQQVKVINKLNQRDATFRVAGPLVPLTEKGGEFGFSGPISLDPHQKIETGREALDSSSNLWGIRFPTPAGDQDSAPKALLACRQCQGAEVVRLNMIEVEVLETAGILAQPCPACQTTTPWGYAENPAEATDSSVPSAVPPPAGAERRKHRRAVLQLPILIRDYFGGVEITKSENVSKGGVAFASEKMYHLGEGVMIACPYDKASQNIEVPGNIASRREVAGTNRKIYGVRYKSKS